MQPTKEQREAIESRQKDIIVSASAGSGKTTTMVSRVIDILKKDENASLKNMLMLTYTEFAASEMKDKLADKLMEEIKSANGNTRNKLREQLDEMALFECGTIHSFCYHVIRNNFERVELSPAVSIIDEEGAEELKNEAVKKVLAEHYANDDGFIDFANLFSFKNDDSLQNSILSLYSFTEAQPDRVGWLKRAKEEAIKPFDQTESAKFYFERVKNMAIIAEQKFLDICNFLENEKCLKNREKVLAWSEYAGEFARVSNVHDIFKTFEKYHKNKFPSKISAELKDNALASEKYEEANEYFNCFQKDILLKHDEKDSIDTWEKYDIACEAYRANQADTLKFIQLVEEFSEEYAEIKERDKYLDYADLEKYALQILKSQESECICKYDYVLIDEYQDVNPVQKEIIMLVSKDKSLFTVGDVKQSIYRFRLADPNIFVERVKECKDNENNGKKLIEFNANFRSSQPVIDFVNQIFNHIMSEDFGKVDYTKTNLIGGANTRTQGEIGGFFYSTTHAKQEKSGVYSVRNSQSEEDEEASNAMREANWVEKKIRSIVGKQEIFDNKEKKMVKVSYKDIAILCFSRSAATRALLKKLQSDKLPINITSFVNAEKSDDVDILVNLLRVINNTHDDYALISVLRSTVFNFSANELTLIKGDKDTACHSKALALAKEGNERFKAVFDYIDELRFQASVLPLSELVKNIIYDKFYDQIMASANGRMRIGALLSFADNLQGKKWSGSLQEFLAFYDDYYVGETPSEEMDGNAINVLTVHGSKGLEFPIVFVVGMGEQFSKSSGENSSPVVADSDLFVHRKIYDSESFQKLKGITFEICKKKQRIEKREDDLRLFYVAITRARDSLYLVGNSSDKLREPWYANSYIEWVKYATRNSAWASAFDIGLSQSEENEPIEQVNVNKPIISMDVADELHKAFTYVYPYEKAVKTGIKFTVTAINKEDDFAVTPMFPADKANKGTAMHAIMEHISFALTNAEEVSHAIEDMVAKGYVDKNEVERIDLNVVLDAIKKLNPIIGKGEILREQNFMLYISAREIEVADIEDKVAVQGKIDLMIKGEENVIIDYKASTAPNYVLKERYSKQLALYAMAAERSLGIKVHKKYIFVLGKNEFIEV